MEFVSFSNDGTLSDDDDDCDWIGDCDTYFKISKVACGPGCTVGSEKKTKVYDNKNSISFFVNENMGSFNNPLKYTFTKWNVSMQ